MTVSGLLNINKPQGITSHDVVVRVRKIVGQRKVGHTGTLDPMATGVLVLCLGQATRLIEYAMPGHKVYRVTLRFGTATDTHDAEGRVTSQQNASHLTAEFIKSLLPAFRGEILQRPPAFSAIKQGGQPLYKAARAGKAVIVDPRPVTIYDLSWLVWKPPDLTLSITCSAGTYIRALARDLGEAAGVGAHLTALIRTGNGPWLLGDAVPLDTLQPDNWQTYLQPLDQAVTHLPSVTLNSIDADHVRHGRQVSPATIDGETNSTVRAYTEAGQFLAILTLVDAEQNLWQPKKVFQK